AIHPRHIFPLASTSLSTGLSKATRLALSKRLIKNGANEVIKAIKRDTAAIVILADTVDWEILSPLITLCEDHVASCVRVKSGHELGRWCGLARPVVAAAVLKGWAEKVKGDIDQAAI
ncbi:ribonucleo protein-associated protein, partial [Amniculicola lignicola CBS 123094]